MDEAFRQLKRLLDKHSVKREEVFSHTSRKPNGSYYFDFGNVQLASEFWTLYKNAVEKRCNLTLMEKPKSLSPLRFDLDFAWPISESPARRYNVADVNKLVKIIQGIIKEVIDTKSPQEKTAWCVLLEKQSPKTVESKQVHKDGFHLHFPFMVVESWAFELITKKVREAIQNEGLFTDKKFVRLDTIVDTGLSKKTWLMYGSAKDSVSEPFLVTKYYKDKINDGGKVCVVRDPKVFWSEFMDQNEGEDPVYHLPSLLSIIQIGTPTPLAASFANQKEVTKPRSVNVQQANRSEKDVLNDYDTVRVLVGMLADERADRYDEWMDVGWTLFNIGLGHPQYLELWIEFSRRSNKCVDGECEEKWSRMAIKGKTLGSLRRMASKDSPSAYSNWCKTQEHHFIEETLKTPKPLENLVAKFVHHLYKDTFVCAHSDKQIWFTFLGNRWSQIEGEGIVHLKKKIMEEVADKYLQYSRNLLDKCLSVQDQNEKTTLSQRAQKAHSMWMELQKVTFVNKVVAASSLHFYDGVFASRFDENKMLFGCNNGVLDLSTFSFRETRPDDYVTLSCGIEYYPHTIDHPNVQTVIAFFRKVFVDEELYDYFFDTLCACLEGGNPNKNFVIHTGPSGGGKTTVMEFIKIVFGDYCIKFPRELFIEGAKNSSAAARPELERVRGRRLALGQEITQREKFNIGVLKELTGNDSFFVRTLWDKGSDIKPMFTLMVCCNDPPQFPGDDDATYDRLKMLEYSSKFVLPAQLAALPVSTDVKEQFRMRRFKADLSFDDDKKKELAPAFLWYLFQRYIQYKRTGLREPAKVTQHVLNYRSRHDPYQLYVGEKLEKINENNYEEGEAPRLTLAQVFSDYSAWFKVTFGEPYAKIKRPEFQANLSKKIGNPTVKGNITFWQGWKMRDLQHEEEEVFKSAGGPGSGSKSESKLGVVATAPSKSKKSSTEVLKKTNAGSRNASASSSESGSESSGLRNGKAIAK